ncbi:MAG: hypothetical protein GXP33_10385 [Spirochaetes bacterium]|nr:hypothetical protein [Spirochaetota bacterium]
MNRIKIVILLLCALIFLGCPIPITQQLFNRITDRTGPGIVILSPEDKSYYTETVTVTGEVADTAGGSESGSTKSLSYKIVSLNKISGAVSVDIQSGGAAVPFTFQFSTSDLDGTIVVQLTALDWNGNQSTVSMTLLDSGNDIPSFQAEPGNHEVSLFWAEVPGADRYTLYYTTDGTLPSPLYGKRIENISTIYTQSSPLVLTRDIHGITNGNLHVFLLEALNNDGSKTWVSGYIKTIPLSTLSLAPKVMGENGSINVSWQSIAGTDEYEVLRSTTLAGSYINISGTYRGTSLSDHQVIDDQAYYYKVKPAMTGAIESQVASGQTFPILADGGEIVGSVDTPGTAYGIDIYGSYAFIADYRTGGSSTMQVIDISTPSAPYLAAAHTLDSGYAFDIAVDGTYAYIAAEGVLQIVDISTPGSPKQQVRLTGPSPNGVQGVAFYNGYLYVACGSTGVYIINTANVPSMADDQPLSTYQEALISVGNFAYDVFVRNNNVIYVADGSNGFLTVDVSTKTAPVTGKKYPNSSSAFPGSGSGKVVSVAVYDDGSHPDGAYAVVADSNLGFYTIDLFSGADYELLASSYFNSPGVPQDVTVDGNYAYLADGSSGIYLLSLADASEVNITAVVNTPGVAERVSLSGGYLYVADGTVGGMQAVSFSLPDSPVKIGNISTSGDAKGLAINGAFAYIADGNSGLQILDISSPDSPSTRGKLSLGVPANDIEVVGNYAFLGCGETSSNGYLKVVNVADPDAPVLVGSAVTTSTAGAMELRGHYLFITDRNTGFEIFDVSDPANPEIVGFYSHSSSILSNDITVNGQYAYLAGDYYMGLVVVDISDLREPAFAAQFSTGQGLGVQVRDSTAYVADQAGGLEVVDVGNLSSISSWPNSSSVLYDLALGGNYVFGVDYSNGLQVYNVSLREWPGYVGSAAAAGSQVRAIRILGRHAFLADGTGLSVMLLE